jgi:hypothetical protein
MQLKPEWIIHNFMTILLVSTCEFLNYSSYMTTTTTGIFVSFDCQMLRLTLIQAWSPLELGEWEVWFGYNQSIQDHLVSAHKDLNMHQSFVVFMHNHLSYCIVILWTKHSWSISRNKDHEKNWDLTHYNKDHHCEE